jgi:hypothetical protein
MIGLEVVSACTSCAVVVDVGALVAVPVEDGSTGAGWEATAACSAL